MVTQPNERHWSARATEAARIALMVVGLVGLAAWTLVVLQSDDPSQWHRDWYKVWDTGRRVVDGERHGLYPVHYDREGGQYFWLYPPYALYPAALLGLLPSGAAYVVLVGLILSLFAASVEALARMRPQGLEDARTMGLLFFASASLNSVVVIGQNSAFWLTFLVAGLWALQRDRPWLAALCFAGWGFKPNWVVAVVLWLAFTRRWKILGGVAALGGLMVVSSLPLGTHLWSDFLSSAAAHPEMTRDSYPSWKLISLGASLGDLLPGPAVGPARWIGTAVLVGCALRIWHVRRDPQQQVAALALLVLAANVYASFYDSLLLVVPAVVWWTRRAGYAPWQNAAIGACVGVQWLWIWGALYGPLARPPSMVGLTLSIWLIVEALATRRTPME